MSTHNLTLLTPCSARHACKESIPWQWFLEQIGHLQNISFNMPFLLRHVLLWGMSVCSTYHKLTVGCVIKQTGLFYKILTTSLCETTLTFDSKVYQTVLCKLAAFKLALILIKFMEQSHSIYRQKNQPWLIACNVGSFPFLQTCSQFYVIRMQLKPVFNAKYHYIPSIYIP